MNKKIVAVSLILGTMISSIPIISDAAKANQANTKQISTQKGSKWFYLSADDKYGIFFEPDSVKVVKKVETSSGKEIPTEIEAWTNTTYTYKGSSMTIEI